MNLKPLFFSMLTVAAVLVSGCTSDSDRADRILQSLNKTNLHKVTNLYNLYQSQHGWVGPETMEQLREFVSGVSKSRLEKMGIDVGDLDSIFVSERDNQEFVVRPSVRGSAMGSVEPVIFEKEGVEGVWLVGFTSRGPREVTSKDEYDQMFNGQWVDSSAPQRNDNAAAAQGQQN